MKTKILVIGPGSLTGSRFIELAKDTFEIYGAGGQMDENTIGLQGFQKLDLTNSQNVEKVISDFPGKVLVNFAGATLVDEIEKSRPKDLEDVEELESTIAYRVNVLGTRYLAKACKKFDKFPIFISTGMVFDGSSGPYNEDDPIANDPKQVSFYAWTKILAEKEAGNSGIDHLVIRISYPYRSEYEGKTDFARTFLTLFDELESGTREAIYPIFSDQTLTPTFTDDLFPAIQLLISKQASGIFNLASPEPTTPYDFCIELLKVARGVDDPSTIIEKGSIVKFQMAHPEKAIRPIQGGERSDKITKLGFSPTSWRDGIKKAYGSK